MLYFMILLINIHYLDISNIIYNILYKSMNKCVSVFDFLCHPVKNFLNKCFGKTKPTVQQNNSKKNMDLSSKIPASK